MQRVGRRAPFRRPRTSWPECRADESLEADEVVVRPLGCFLCAEIGDQTLVVREFIGYVPQQFLSFVFGVAYQYEVNVLAVDPEP